MTSSLLVSIGGGCACRCQNPGTAVGEIWRMLGLDVRRLGRSCWCIGNVGVEADGKDQIVFLSSTGVMWWCGPLYGCAGFYIEAE